mgnify:CR=1 FL=1
MVDLETTFGVEAKVRPKKDFGVPFSYNPNEHWDCKRIYDESFKNDILNRIKLNYQNNEFKLWFDLNEFDIKDVNVSLTKYYSGKWLD